MTQTAPPTTELAEKELSPVGDSELLAHFVSSQQEDAFREIVNRHGPLVMGVCVRVLSHREDAEDAFQAAFIVLSKRASRIRKRESLSAWLYGVAYRVAVDIARKRQRSEQSLVTEPMHVDDPFAKLEHEFDRQVVDEEIQRLPKRFRTPLILFYLTGKTSKEIATELGESQGTIDGRIKRGRQELRLRLTRRGVALTGLLSAIAISAEQASAAMSPALVHLTVSAGVAGSSGAAMPETISTEALRFAGKEMLRMSLIKPLTITLCVALCATVGAILPQAFAGPQRGTGETTIDTRHDAPVDPQLNVALVSLQTQNTPQATEQRRRNPFESEARSTKNVNSTLEARMHFLLERRTANARIEAVLWTKAETITGGDSLKAVLDFISLTHSFKVVPDRVGLAAIGVTSLEDITVSEDLQLDGLRVESALKIILASLEDTDRLDFVIKDEVLMITSPEVAKNTLDTRVYHLNLPAEVKTHDLMETLDAALQTEDAPREVMTKIIGKKLVVRHNRRGHNQLLDFLAQMDLDVSTTAPMPAQ